MDWRDALDPVLQEDLNALLQRVHKEKKAYSSGNSVSRAQLWCALALLSQEVSTLQIQVKHLEKQLPVKVNEKLRKELRKL